MSASRAAPEGGSNFPKDSGEFPQDPLVGGVFGEFAKALVSEMGWLGPEDRRTPISEGLHTALGGGRPAPERHLVGGAQERIFEE